MKDKKFTDNKVFVMTRPSEGENFLSITTADMAKQDEELDELYHMAFFDYFLNLSKILTVKQHKVILTSSTAPLAYQYFLANDEKARQIINISLQELEKEKVDVSFLKKMPDEVSMLDYIIRHNLSLFLNDVKKQGIEKSLAKHHTFYVDLEQLFFSLPACFCFSLIDAVNHLTAVDKKTTPRKK